MKQRKKRESAFEVESTCAVGTFGKLVVRDAAAMVEVLKRICEELLMS